MRAALWPLAGLGLVALLVAGAVALTTPPKADPRPQAGTIACRDAQIAKLETLPVNVYSDDATDYERDNAAVVEILDTADQLKQVCR